MRYIVTTTIIGFTLSMSGVSSAQDTQDADELMSDSIGLMEESKWSEALVKVRKVIDTNKDGASSLGPKFGVAYYYQGLCQLKLAQQGRKESRAEEANALYLEAISSFQQCYAIKNTEEQTLKGSSNNYRIKALKLKGSAEQALDKFDEAIKSYNKFLLERNNIRDTFDVAYFNINLAICYWNTGKAANDEKAEQLYLRAIKATYQSATTRSKLTGLRAMLENYSTREKLVTVEDFMSANGEHFRVSREEAVDALPYVSALTLKASQLNLTETVKALSNAIPSEEIKVLSDYSADDFKKLVELKEGVELDAWKAGDEGDGVEAAIVQAEQLAVCARAILFETQKNYEGALAGYEVLLEYGNLIKGTKADYLYNAARVALAASNVEKSFKYGSVYVENFPEHKHYLELQKLLMVTYYFTGEFRRCQLIGEKGAMLLSPISVELDWYTFTLGGAYYYERNFVAAEKLLLLHSKEFPQSEYRDVSSYLYASTLGKLQHWGDSIDLLDKYIGSNLEDKTYLPFAKYDKAYALYSIQKYSEALVELAPFQTSFQESVIKPEAHILLGNIYSVERNRTRAETEYRTAIVAAKKVDNQHAKEEAYYLVISLLGQRTWDGLANPQLLDTVPQLEAFLKEPDAHKSPYFTQIITASFTALERAKRKDEAYDKLEEAIFKYNLQPNTAGTDAAIKTYTIAKRKEDVSDEDVIAGLSESKYILNTPYHAGLLTAIELDVLELSQKLSPNEARAEKIGELYLNLHVEHDIQLLDNFVLIKIAEFMKTNGGIESDTNAKSYYQAVLDSGSKIKQPQAFVGLATELAKSDNLEDREDAAKQFQSIINDPFTRAAPKAAAHYQLIEILYDQKNYAELTKQIRAYLKYPSAAKDDIRRVEMLLAISYDKQDLKDKAIGAYNAVWVNSFENLDQSAPAIDRITDLIWERNNPAEEGLQDGKSDKQLAYETSFKFIRRTEKHYENIRSKMTEDGIQAWERTKAKIFTFEADNEVKALK